MKHKVSSSKDNSCIELRHLCLNLINMYDLGMGMLDIVDYLCFQYCVDWFMHNKKWWSFITWRLGSAITKAHVIHC